MNGAPPPRYGTLPLPERAFLPGRSPRPVHDAREVPFVPPERFVESAAFLHGVDLFNHGFFWEAHEAWEGLWRRCVRGSAQHRLLQGLIQIGAAYLKHALDEAAPGADLLARGTARLCSVAAEQDPFHGIRVREFVDACRASPTRAPQLRLLLP